MALEGKILLDDANFHNIEQVDIENRKQKDDFKRAIRELRHANFEGVKEPDFEVDEKVDDSEPVDFPEPLRSHDAHHDPYHKHEKHDTDDEPIMITDNIPHPVENLITPVKQNFDEVKEEDVEESPESKRHELVSSSKKTDLREGVSNEDSSPAESPNEYDQIEQEYRNGVEETNEKIEGEGEYLQEGEEEDEDHNDQIPLLFVDVNLGENVANNNDQNNKNNMWNYSNTDRIVLYDGDDPAKVAKEFAMKHSLDASMAAKLTDLLTKQMNSVLAKIVEEGEEGENEER